MAKKKQKEKNKMNKIDKLFILMSGRISEGESVADVFDDMQERHELTEEECETLFEQLEGEIAEDLIKS